MVCLDTPASRATSSNFRPASTCLRTAIISASVCLALDMLLPLFRTAKSYSVLCGFRGAGQLRTGQQDRAEPGGADRRHGQRTHFNPNRHSAPDRLTRHVGTAVAAWGLE